MSEIRWEQDEESWVAAVSSDVFEDLKVLIRTEGESDPPSDIQRRTLEVLQNLRSADLSGVRTAVRAWAEENLDPAQYESDEDDVFDVEFHTTVIPPLKESESRYFFLVGNSELDWEHGLSLALISKDGVRFCVCEESDPYEDFETDEVEEFEQMLEQPDA